MAKKYHMAVFIGRFQIFHHGHLKVIEQALDEAEHLLVLVGSTNTPRCHRNPFTYEERKYMIESSVPAYLHNKIMIRPLLDHTYNESRWISEVQNSVERAVWAAGYLDTVDIALIGHSKDHSSYYLKMFPQFANIEAPNYMGLSSTNIREAFFENNGKAWYDTYPKPYQILPQPVVEFLNKFRTSNDYSKICDEYDFIRKYKESWEAAPYAPTFVTVDAVVVQSGHVLLVKRKANPGKGLWALPGGFINAQEKIRDAVIRELREETKIRVPDPVLRGSIVAHDVFDDPNRSARGRTITHVFLIKLKDDVELPTVRGSDDALKAKWEPINQLKRELFFEDHFGILENMLARI